jgi:hypothetical protein
VVKPSKSRPLYERLAYAFGRDAVHREMARLISGARPDPLQYMNDEGRQLLFDNLLADLRYTKRNNARNRRIAAERKTNG